MSELLVVRSKIKDYAKNKKGETLNVSGDFGDVLSKRVEEMIKEAVRRAEENGRRTVQSRDL